MKKLLYFILCFFVYAPSVYGEDYENDSFFEEGKPTVQPTYDLQSIPFGQIQPSLAKIAYSGGEKFKYDVSWTGGVKIGELFLEIKEVLDEPDTYEISAKVTTDNGVFDFIYPVKDTHVTMVKGEQRLPFHYEIWQKEGRSYRAHKVITYDQKNGKIVKRKNKNPGREFRVKGITHNEFSSFFSSRVMSLEVGKPIKVPTFADNKRNEVVVETMRETLLKDTVLGNVDTIEVMPILKFTGLYDKQGDTVIWYTNDECRVPVLINSKIVVGSLTSKLVSYENPSCKKYTKSGFENKKLSLNENQISF